MSRETSYLHGITALLSAGRQCIIVARVLSSGSGVERNAIYCVRIIFCPLSAFCRVTLNVT